MLSYENRPGIPPPSPLNPDHLPLSTSKPNTVMTTDLTSANSSQPKTSHHHIWLVTGPAGCGKSTVAEFVANSMNLPYIEGDAFHPATNIEKMSHGIPLSDADRWDWLTALREEAIRNLASGHQGVVLTCSALKRKYRDVIRVAHYYNEDVLVHFIYLHAPEDILQKRVAARKGHYMGADMVHSQFGILEAPGVEEKDVISVDVSRSVEEVEADALEKIKLAIQESLNADS